MKKSYKIEVDCANCANKMEEAAKNTAGVKDATVNFMMLKMNVEFEEGYYQKPIKDTFDMYKSHFAELYANRDDKYVCLMDIALMAMKKLKKEIRWFSIMEYEKEENYLSKRHLEGWKFKSVTFPGLYTFERCEPEKIIYQLDYNKEGIKHQSEYVRMFEDCGWEYLTEFDGYNYFRKPADKMQQKEEIFCDDISRLDMMNRIFRGRVIPLIVILCGLIVQLYMSATDHSERGWLPVFIVLVIIYIITFLQFAIKYFAFRKKVK